MVQRAVLFALVAGCSHQGREPATPLQGRAPAEIDTAPVRDDSIQAGLDKARRQTKLYAFEAYPSWAASNPSQKCPGSLDELNEWLSKPDTKDPWGTPYKMLCGSDLPPGAKGIGVVSFGPDRMDDTADDIKSWE